MNAIMNNQETKNQHWVPQVYLKAFSKERKKNEFQIYALDKKTMVQPLPINIKKVCAENNLYTLSGNTEEQRQLIENFYGKLFDDNYNKFYSILTNADVKQISTLEKRLIISIVITFLFRNPRLRDVYKSIILDVFKDKYSDAHKNKEYFFIDKEKIKTKGFTIEESYKSYINKSKDIFNIQQVDFALKLIELRMNDQIQVVKIEEPDHSLLTSDHPVTLFNENNSIIAPFDIENEIKMPIDSKHNLYIYPYNTHTKSNCINRTTHKGNLSKTEMLSSNCEQQIFANKFLLGFKEDLENYIYFNKNQHELFSKSELK